MRTRTMHIQGFDDSGPVCGATGRVWTDTDWSAADSDPGFKRCERCEKKLGPGGLERLTQAREELARLHAARKAGEADGREKTPSRVSVYPAGGLEAQSYARGYDAGAVERLPPKAAIRATPPGLAEFLMTLEAAKGRAHDYSDEDRAIVTRAINRANRSLANRPAPCGHTSGPTTERRGLGGPVTREFTATRTLPAGHAGSHEDENERTSIGRPFAWGDPFRKPGAPD